MKDLNTISHFEPIEKITELLMARSFNHDPLFFRLIVAYFLTKIASMMRTEIELPTGDVIPVNTYICNLAPSGAGKTSSIRIIEKTVVNKFHTIFMYNTLPELTEKHLAQLAIERANWQGLDPDTELEVVQREYKDQGRYFAAFDSGTSPAAKQMRHKLLMCKVGALNLEIDEIGNNLLGNKELLDIFLELFDTGEVKHKLVKNTADNKRVQEILGGVPANMLLFGTPAKLLLPGSKQEDEFMSMLDTGYARRCLFGYNPRVQREMAKTPAEILKIQKSIKANPYVTQLSNHLGKLANPLQHGITMTMKDPVALLYQEYLLLCDKRASKLSDFDIQRKIELQHRHSKAIKLAGAFAFIEQTTEITEEQFYWAMKLVEESGDAFTDLLSRESNYSILANYIADYERELTITDMMESLSFFKGSEASKKEMISRAIEYGHSNNIVIKKTYRDNIEFYTGERMEVTNLDKINIAYSTDITANYLNEEVPFTRLPELITADGYHYTAHHFKDGYRTSTNAIPGIHLAILDVDKDVTLNMAAMLLKDYTAIFATTKRHTKDNHRFRIILPLSHKVKLDPENYSKFMQNIFKWLPFNVDDQTKDCARKWESFNGQHYIQTGKLLNALHFIPNTRAEENQSKKIREYSNLSSLERWFCLNTDIGNRNNQLIRYALALVDSGMDAPTIRETLRAFNQKLQYPINDSEIDTTTMKTVVKKLKKLGRL